MAKPRTAAQQAALRKAQAASAAARRGGGSVTARAQGKKVDPWATRLSGAKLKARLTQAESDYKAAAAGKYGPNMPLSHMKSALQDLRTEARRRARAKKR